MDDTSCAEALVEQLTGAFKDGLEDAEKRLYPALRVLETQYITAQADPKARIPTALSIAIVHLLTFLPRP